MAIEIEQFKKDMWERIQILNSTIWENRILKTKVDNWLQNFSQEEEKVMALYLLSEFMYFGDSQMRVLLKSLYRDLFRYPIIEVIRKSLADTLDSNAIELKFSEELKNTRFIGIGNPSESGAHLLYFFRQENNLSKRNFIQTDEINTAANIDVQRVVFLDDFCGSGSQVKRDKGLTDFVTYLKTTRPGVKIDYLMLVGTEVGIANIAKTSLFDNVNAVIQLDNSFKVFESNSRYFMDVDLPFVLDEVKKFASEYGSILIAKLCEVEGITIPAQIAVCASNNALGFGNCQLLVGFHHNTPDNTLPIIWYDEKNHTWNPIFKRYNKKYNF